MKCRMISAFATGLVLSTSLAGGIQTQCTNRDDNHTIQQQIMALKICAMQGDTQAQTQLARLYRLGINGAPDNIEAAKWYRAAARQGNAEAQFHLGVMYLEGIGVTENSAEALRWISRAAQQNHAGATEVYNYILHHDGPLEC